MATKGTGSNDPGQAPGPAGKAHGYAVNAMQLWCILETLTGFLDKLGDGGDPPDLAGLVYILRDASKRAEDLQSGLSDFQSELREGGAK
jgi:hypothetical protein